MARFEKIISPKNLLLSSRTCYFVKGEITFDDVNKLNSLNENIFLILENTRGQNSEIIKTIDGSKIQFSVMGGIDYIHKKKYAKDDYISRTIYNPKNLSNIIKIFENMERKIDYSWTESQKCMYVYKTLCESMYYGENQFFINECDVARSNNALFYNLAVCSGFALIFKEAMDRLGIECYYQNLIKRHSWNAVKLDGAYHLLDLTWDVCNKSNEGMCTFSYFCNQDGKQFYNDESHNISNDSEEIAIPATSMSKEQVKENLEVISRPKELYSHEMRHTINSEKEEFDYIYLGESAGLDIYAIRRDEKINYFYINKGENIRKSLNDRDLNLVCSRYNHNISRGELPSNVKHLSRYSRKDGSNFIICQTNKKLDGGVKEFLVIEPATINGKHVLKRTSIISESDLVDCKDEKFKYVVANSLLSEERLKRKIKNFNGYVGYVSSDYAIYYDKDFEVNNLGIQNRS